MTRIPRSCWLALLLAAAAPGKPARAAFPPLFPVPGDSTLEYQVKAAYLLRFAQFVSWPAQAFSSPSDPIHIGVMAGDPIGPILDSMVVGREAQGRRIVVRHLGPDDPLDGIQLLFVGQLRDRDRRGLLQRAGTLAVLTVGDGDRFLQDGGGIGLLRIDETIRFGVNLRTVERTGLRIDARALAVAYVVHDR
ncbi:MAG TPA: YfiR family protein [Gemmatimonadales bacterium]|nr:YfiR family protein [Gemmatimonadales bacterium]